MAAHLLALFTAGVVLLWQAYAGVHATGLLRLPPTYALPFLPVRWPNTPVPSPAVYTITTCLCLYGSFMPVGSLVVNARTGFGNDALPARTQAAAALDG